MAIPDVLGLKKSTTMQPESYTRIEDWLKSIDFSVLATTEEVGNITPQVLDGTTIPSTPLRHLNQGLDETSPTDTSFCPTTIFDTPELKDTHCDHTPPSDCCDSQDAYSDHTTVYPESHEPSNPRKLDTPDGSIILNSSSASCDQTCTTVSSATRGQDEGIRVVSLTSCLQCIRLRLTCSRTYPSCTRCERKGHADQCLLHRRLFASEIEEDVGPVLLKVKGEDKEMWKRKLELREALWEEWMIEQDRKNWVLPSVEGVRGGRRKWGVWEEERWPGEGMGRVVLQELEVDLED